MEKCVLLSSCQAKRQSSFEVFEPFISHPSRAFILSPLKVAPVLSHIWTIGSVRLVTLRTAQSISNVMDEFGLLANCAHMFFLMVSLEPAMIRSTLLPLSSVIHPSLMKPKFSHSDSTTALLFFALRILFGLASLLFLTFGFIRKVAPATGVNWLVLSMIT